MSDIFICLSEENKGPSARFLARYRRSLRWPLEMNGVHVLYSLIIQLTASRKEAYIFYDSFYFPRSQHITIMIILNAWRWCDASFYSW